MKRVISLWLPKFATDRLCRLRQDWLDSPLALVDDTGGKLVLHAVNTVAEQAGIRTGMTLADARAILPNLQTSEADFEAENRTLTQLSDWCGGSARGRRRTKTAAAPLSAALAQSGSTSPAAPTCSAAKTH
jgi:nucleotidyltransferase/DNA polymerase involved in DNA repair